MAKQPTLAQILKAEGFTPRGEVDVRQYTPSREYIPHWAKQLVRGQIKGLVVLPTKDSKTYKVYIKE